MAGVIEHSRMNDPPGEMVWKAWKKLYKESYPVIIRKRISEQRKERDPSVTTQRHTTPELKNVNQT
jgi:hypothetical protein